MNDFIDEESHKRLPHLIVSDMVLKIFFNVKYWEIKGVAELFDRSSYGETFYGRQKLPQLSVHCLI